MLDVGELRPHRGGRGADPELMLDFDGTRHGCLLVASDAPNTGCWNIRMHPSSTERRKPCMTAIAFEAPAAFLPAWWRETEPRRHPAQGMQQFVIDPIVSNTARDGQLAELLRAAAGG